MANMDPNKGGIAATSLQHIDATLLDNCKAFLRSLIDNSLYGSLDDADDPSLKSLSCQMAFHRTIRLAKFFMNLGPDAA